MAKSNIKHAEIQQQSNKFQLNIEQEKPKNFLTKTGRLLLKEAKY